MVIITTSDLPIAIQSHELAAVMVAGANSKAMRVAPCLAATDPAPTAEQVAEAKLVLIGAVKRWAEAGSGAFQQQTAGPFSIGVDTRQRAGFNLWPSEITDLQAICRAGADAESAYALDLAPTSRSPHMPWCNLMFGAVYCSCGADLTDYEYPLYEGGRLSPGC